MTLINCSGLSHAFGGHRRRVALSKIEFTVGPGELLGLVGPNGAGKTTLLRILAGELVPGNGRVTVGGFRAGTRAARRVVGYAADPPLLPQELTALEWLKYLASHRADRWAERVRLVREAVELAQLEEFVGRRIATYSRGMCQRTAIAAACVAGQTALLLDEALSGIDPLVSRDLRAGLARLAAQGRCVIAASHDLAALERFATRVIVLWRGGIVADLAMAQLIRERVVELSLNGAALTAVPVLQRRFPGAVRTGDGVAVPLTNGLTAEQVLTACQSERIAVAASRVRFRALEDLLVRAAETNGEAA